MCSTGKVAYENRSIAKEALRRIQSRFHGRRKGKRRLANGLFVYHCKECGQWHLSSTHETRDGKRKGFK